jgi:hypothetical protein
MVEYENGPEIRLSCKVNYKYQEGLGELKEKKIYIFTQSLPAAFIIDGWLLFHFPRE